VPSEYGAEQLFTFNGDHLFLAPNWQRRIEDCVKGADLGRKSQVASALQHRIGLLLLEFVRAVRRRFPDTEALCLGGSLFHNSYFNSQVKKRGGFDHVFVPVNPGNGGLSVGAALHANGGMRVPATPYLGPAYSSEEIKATLDNCKLTYQWTSETETISIAVEELKKGHLLAWFDGPMEWGPRALGARSIVASPLAPYVLDNLNRFLKQRETWRGYALSGLATAVHDFFDGPSISSFMECDYLPRDRALFRNILPSPDAAVRVHTVGDEAMPRFRELIRQFEAATGVPFVVNTSFNGFQEPIVCSPRDAIRVFYGTGIDVLVLGQFVIRK
jgi:carbamoyltransferase